MPERKYLMWCAIAVALTMGAATPASASQLCTADPSNPLPNPVFVTGTNGIRAELQPIGAALAGTTTIIYTSPGSCQGIDAIVNGAGLGTGTATYWDSAGAAHTCTLSNENADVGVSDVYAASCVAPFVFPSVPSGIQETFGPNQVMAFVVPAASTASTISGEAAYMVYGFGTTTYAVNPWNDAAYIFQRGALAGPQLLLAAAIRVPSSKWLPATPVAGGSGGMLDALVGAAKPSAAIGILTADITDGVSPSSTGGSPTPNRSLVKILAYQHIGQSCAYLPDSSSTTFDKRNVRSGDYALWGPIHFFTKTAGLKTAAADLIGYFNNSVPAPTGVHLLDLEIKAHTVPQCAMKVSRKSEIGPTSAYKDPNPCGCYMEELLSPGSSSCTPCTGASGCSAGSTCSHGYCEAM